MSPLKEGRSSLMSLSAASEESVATMMEEDSVLSSPPQSVHSGSSHSRRSRLSFGRKSPDGSRRLFDEGSAEYSPPSPQRPVLRPLNLHLEIGNNKSDVGRPGIQPFYLPPLHGRKRSSEDRRSSPSAASSDSMMQMSPHMSPNSFKTIDGRFVSSKNPFSSPMMMEDDAMWASSSAPGPSMPESFYASDDQRLTMIPPRHRAGHHQHQVFTSACSSNSSGSGGRFSGFPDHRFSFTGSPIHEHMETETATNGSLFKVRKLRMSDDIVAASEQHVSAYNRLTSNLTIDPSVSSQQIFDQEISPTEVINFPPPTPVKARPNRSAYASIRTQEPMTPFVERRTPTKTAAFPARTPHPGSYIHNPTSDESSNERKSRFHTDFDIIEEIGNGCFGKVFKVLSRLDGCMYAVKAGRRAARGESDRDRMLKEVYALAALSDQADTAAFHIVRYHQAWMEENLLYIQTELCSGTLMNEIAAGPLGDQRRYKLLREMLLALEFIHKHDMIHLDIKPANILLKNDQYKLGDFGLVTQASLHQDVEEGDSRYMSLELLNGHHNDLTKSDIFSLGATLYEICSGRPLPLDGQEWQDIRAGRLNPLPNTRHDMAMIIKQMMDPVAANRPSASKLLEHPQLLSDEQKALLSEKSKVLQANIQLAAQARQMNSTAASQLLMPATKRGLVRANTWSGGPLPYT